ncbi:hypothetical protein P171DRAFT_487512 [Karstenula rhodostoma CBS 690.94]|uniref:Uncharacterized protein n=1 Tax=Karstenula rhodostoma CBS 690.94 TaxID=1392251 RepID=A0A9P4PDS8_9PLEO|nr:hypothetical protein P171DRAFT_487512 [Karstenula rhodostoma CBS 690.94]
MSPPIHPIIEFVVLPMLIYIIDLHLVWPSPAAHRLQDPSPHLRTPCTTPPTVVSQAPARHETAKPEQARFPLCARIPFVSNTANRGHVAGESNRLNRHHVSPSASSCF